VLVLVVGWFVVRRMRPPPPKRLVVTMVSEQSAPETIEHSVTEPVEQAASGIDSVQRLESRSTNHTTTLTLTLEPSADLAVASQALLVALTAAMPRLPSSTLPATITKESRVVRYVVQGELPLVRTVRDTIRPALEVVAGVTFVRECGTRELGVNITIDGARVAANGMTVDEITHVLRSGALRGRSSIDSLRSLSLGSERGSRTLGDLATIEERDAPANVNRSTRMVCGR